MLMTSARQQLFADFDGLVAELETEMATSLQSQEISELYADQMTALLAQRGSGASLQRMACGKFVCAAEVSTPAGANDIPLAAGEEPVRVPLDSVVRLMYHTDDGTKISRIVFTPSPRLE